ncbi:cryptochrome/photolyase family protein [Sediminibacterium ginsengisoli]|uniref:Deoxyribodipyrimidine photo-lyase n=1 Tax=Sediminibacterium ginsengisoli TaxID=413434 RepID=A0A1T4MYT3_9BACT|nr:deoxyribodipyrimidine photo-lyase [Sediminibacterium ginsengisoli]SJZ72270.1 deoxyribodipyrimidine photo-lyase [Sediminibacterium ginsengisoli]
MPEVNIMWFRRDLRLTDNAALYHALKSGHPVVPVFIFDRNILDKLEDRADRRVTFIHQALEAMQQQLAAQQSSLEVYYGRPAEVFQQLTEKYKIGTVFTNHDYEPYAKERDEAIRIFLRTKAIAFKTYKDQVIFEKDEVLKEDGTPYTVFTPFSKKWLAKLNPFYLKSYPVEKYAAHFYRQAKLVLPSLEELGFIKKEDHIPPQQPDESVIERYDQTRDYPGQVHGTSHLGVHLRFGTISIRQLAAKAVELNQTYLKELIWREFYQMILWHFPHVGKGHAFRKEYDKITWRNNEAEFERWCNGTTGYPIVDAGMRELNETGYMHNRVRMIVASFLTKHLLIDWRWGEAYFAEKLLDYDLAANNGGWQWASGSGCDAAPYFRVFNPRLQTEKFDKQLTYIRKWVPELESLEYPAPIVAHEAARKRVMDVYAKALKN